MVWTSVCLGGLAFAVGCGGGGSSSGGGGNNNPPPTITSFSASPAAIDPGASASLTAVFSNGSAVITPGNLTAASGTAVSVSPTSTTTYTLTVTGSSGTTPATQTATVTVNPKITSFSASATEIESGTSVNLTAVFGGGTGVITAPGGYSANATSGTAVSVSPASTTTYTLTVTGSSGTTPATLTTTVTVDPKPAITSFAADQTNIVSGSPTNLTAVFTGGTGVITAPSYSSGIITSGTAVTVHPTTNTTYTLTVSPPVSCTGCATATMTASVTVTAPLISSFTANPTFIASGKNSNLIPVFSGGAGVITPGNISVTSGASVPVTPTATTTYTLTVTPTGGGTPQTSNTTVTVYAITSFTASPNPIVSGGSTQLTGVFANGTGVITPGNLSVTSGTPVTVSPAATTIYTLTVTPTQGSGSPITQNTTVTVNTSVSVDLNNLGPTVTNHLLGMNLAMWYDNISNGTPIVAALRGAGITAVRWPGGSSSDLYHWDGTATYPATGTPFACSVLDQSTGQQLSTYVHPNNTFTNFLNNIVTQAGLDLAVTADYGTDAACTGPGQPAEAASWAAAAVAAGVPIHYMTVGNEVFGNWEADLHSPLSNQHNPTVYASAMVDGGGTNGFYSSIKTASPSTLVGAVVDPNTAGWDSNVLANAKNYYDFVEYHYYPQYGNVTSDTYLVQQAALDFTKNINKLKSELTTAGVSGTPIYVGELGANSSNPGTQSWSITQGLYAGQILGEAMNDGIIRLSWWIGFGNCGGAGNNSASLYGWQNTWGAFNVFSDADPNCPGEGPIGTMSPTAQAFNLFQNVAVTGEHALTASVNGDTTNIRAYAASHSGGAAIVLFNLNQNASATVSLALPGQSSSTDVKVTTYDKALYDQTHSATPVWAQPSSTDMGAQNLPLSLTLTPWSMNVVLVK